MSTIPSLTAQEKPFAEEVFHPLSHAYVLRVFPFWVTDGNDDDLPTCDISDKAIVFDEGGNMEEEGLLHLPCAEVVQDHGSTIADQLIGCTGLYVVVSDIQSTAERVDGDVLSFTQTSDGILELIVKHNSCLTIYAEPASPRQLSLAA